MTMYAEARWCTECEEHLVGSAGAICVVCLDKRRIRPTPLPDDGPPTPSDRLPVADHINRSINPGSTP